MGEEKELETRGEEKKGGGGGRERNNFLWLCQRRAAGNGAVLGMPWGLRPPVEVVGWPRGSVWGPLGCWVSQQAMGPAWNPSMGSAVEVKPGMRSGHGDQ